MFLPGGVLSIELTDKIKHQLKDRKNLEDNEIDLINCLLSTYIRANINSKKKLSKLEKRLLGQLAVLAFWDVPNGLSISLLNFPHSQKIGLAKLPRQLKLGEEKHNKQIYKSRIQMGKRRRNH